MDATQIFSYIMLTFVVAQYSPVNWSVHSHKNVTRSVLFKITQVPLLMQGDGAQESTMMKTYLNVHDD